MSINLNKKKQEQSIPIRIEKFKLKARLILIDQGEILMLKQTKPHGGKYTLVGGTVENWEMVKESLVRETQEEAGITLKKGNLRLVHTLCKKGKSDTRIILYFVSVKYKGKPISLEPKKFKSVSWHSLENLPTPLSPTVDHVLKHFKEGIPFSEIDRRK